MRRWTVPLLTALSLFACIVGLRTPSSVGEQVAPTAKPVDHGPVKAVSLLVEPPQPVLFGTSARQRLLITARLSDGSDRDVTAHCTITVPEDSCAAWQEGRLLAQANGTAKVVVKYQGVSLTVAVAVKRFGEEPLVSFLSHVTPVLNKHGCNARSCHGASGGKGGFELSLFGSDPNADFNAVSERSETGQQAAASLILQKPTMQETHGGGKRFPIESSEYRSLRKWIDAGAPAADDPYRRVQSLELYPQRRLQLPAETTQRLIVVAKYANGLTEDVTEKAKFWSNDDYIATVDAEGVVSGQHFGETAVAVRYLDQVALTSVAVPLDASKVRPVPSVPETKSDNIVDQHVQSRLQELGITASPRSDDATFLRRVHFDVIGIPPTIEETRAFLAGSDANKRAKLIDELLVRPEFAEFWATKWSDWLRLDRYQMGEKGSLALRAWLVESFRSNKPYNEFARELIAAEGPHGEQGPPNYFFQPTREPADVGASTAQLFLGVRLDCARCHNHPFENWNEQDFWGFAAFFARVGYHDNGEQNEIVRDNTEGDLYTTKNDAAPPKFLDNLPVSLKGKEPRRPALARWMTSPNNPWFAQATVNRLWKQLLGRGIVDPVDDFRPSNPPSHPALLAALTDDFTTHGFDVRRTLRLILTSETYQASAEPTPQNTADRQFFSRYTLRRLTSPQLLDAVSQATGVPQVFEGLPEGTKATQVLDNNLNAEFLDVCGRNPRQVVAEYVPEVTTLQALYSLASYDFQEKIGHENGRAHKLAESFAGAEEIVDELYLTSLCRFPTTTEKSRCIALLKESGNRQQGIEDLLWALVTSKEFLFQH